MENKDAVIDGTVLVKYKNNSVKNVIVPDGITKISENAFKDMARINTVIIPEGVSSIGKQAFCCCTKLKSVVFPKSLRIIGDEAFLKCRISDIDLNEGLESIGARAFEDNDIYRAVVPKSVRKVGMQAFSGASIIEIYDSIDPDAKDAYAAIDRSNGEPNSMVGYIGAGTMGSIGTGSLSDCAASHIWGDHTITVRSSQTGDVKYKVWMGADSRHRDYYCFLASAWGRNGTFAFKELDEYFPKILSKWDKLSVAKCRLMYPYELSEEAEARYIAYIKKAVRTGLCGEVE